jgi:hypothetical protein
MANFKVPKSSIFSCEKCDYFTSRKSQYERHLLTDKHKLSHVGLTETNNLVPKVPLHTCQNCGNTYKHQSSLCKHKKICQPKQEKEDLSNFLLKENAELKKMIIDVCKNSNNVTNNTMTNSCNNNKTFNLQFFLNETCKDAMNLMEFVDSVKLQLSDLEKVGEVGFVEGISNIIVKNLNSLDETKRPIHCTDAKREVLYVKDDNKWEKEEEEKNKLRKLIKKIAHRNSRQLINFKENHPDCGKSVSPFSDQYNKLVIEAYGGKGEDYDNENKIIKKIAKEVIVEKK